MRIGSMRRPHHFRFAAVPVALAVVGSAVAFPFPANAAPAVPGAPRAVVAIPGKTLKATGPLQVAFAAPTSNGGSAILDYRVVCESANGGVRVTTTSVARSVTIGGATTGKAYRCRARARNAVGYGPLSAESLPVVVGAPAAPTIGAISRSSAGVVRVAFTPNANNGSPLTAFRLACASTDGGIFRSRTVSDPLKRALSVNGLTVGRTYGCRVQAINARGVGVPSNRSASIVA